MWIVLITIIKPDIPTESDVDNFVDNFEIYPRNSKLYPLF